MHIGGFDQFDQIDFDKRKVRYGFRKAGQIVTARAQMLLALGKGRDGYPNNRTGALLHAINYKVSRAGFLVKIMPDMPAGAKDYYPAYLHYGVRRGAVRRKDRRAQAKTGPWRIAPRDNYITDALQDSAGKVESTLSRAMARALRPK
nr:hypothetical protein [Crenobacter caeni]